MAEGSVYEDGRSYEIVDGKFEYELGRSYDVGSGYELGSESELDPAVDESGFTRVAVLVNGFVKVEVESDTEDPEVMDCSVVEAARLLWDCGEGKPFNDWFEELDDTEELELDVRVELVVDADVDDGIDSEVEAVEEAELLLGKSEEVPEEVSDAIEDVVLLEEPELDDTPIEVLLEVATEELVSLEDITLDEDASTDVVELAKKEAAPDAVSRLDKALAEVAVEAVLEDDEELDTTELVVKLARRLEAEADDELGAAGETPILSALMISAAYFHVRFFYIK
ncbi:MAG: hypothetical protein Q9174_003538 [Haloplaca sp. 1 TL-2023]